MEEGEEEKENKEKTRNTFKEESTKGERNKLPD